MTPLMNFEQFVKELNEHNFPHSVDPQRQIVELPSKAAPLPGNLIIKWEKSLPFIQLIHFMVVDVPVERVREVETALVRVNNRLEVGGFGFDHETRRLYCRLTIPVFAPEGISASTLNQLGSGCVRNAREFYEAFKAVIDGQPGESIVEIYTGQVQARQKPVGQA